MEEKLHSISHRPKVNLAVNIPFSENPHSAVNNNNNPRIYDYYFILLKLPPPKLHGLPSLKASVGHLVTKAFSRSDASAKHN